MLYLECFVLSGLRLLQEQNLTDARAGFKSETADMAARYCSSSGCIAGFSLRATLPHLVNLNTV